MVMANFFDLVMTHAMISTPLLSNFYLGYVIDLYTAEHGGEGEDCGTVPNYSLVVKCALSVHQQYCHLIG